MFKLAKDLAPTIIFIDEIDSINSLDSDNNQQILNELLTLIDVFRIIGVEEENHIIINPISNMIQALDETLIRPCLFSHKNKID